MKKLVSGIEAKVSGMEGKVGCNVKKVRKIRSEIVE